MIELLLELGELLFERGTLGNLLYVKVRLPCLLLDLLLLDVDLVKTDDLLLKLLEIREVIQTLKNIILELLFETVLLLDVHFDALCFILHSGCLHTHIFNDQLEVGVHACKML